MGNRFRDHTDVQPIFFSMPLAQYIAPGISAECGSFAELMLYARPTPAGTQVSHNDADPDAIRRCGSGIIIGSAP